MQDFEYEAPTALAEAIEHLDRTAGARPLAGGTDLIDQLRTERLVSKLVVDVKKIPELNVLSVDEGGLLLGAAVPCYRISGSREIAERYSALHDSSQIIGGIQIQSRASVGGNLCNSSPAADTTPSVIALGGVCHLQGPQGRREVAAEDFCTGPGKNVLGSGELLVDIQFPAVPARFGSHYRRFTPRNEMDIAVVGVAAAVALDESGQKILSARIVLGGVAPTPLLATDAGDSLAGQPADSESYGKAASLARKIVVPITDMRGTEEYRTHLAGVLTERVLAAAVARARGEAVDYRPGH